MVGAGGLIKTRPVLKKNMLMFTHTSFHAHTYNTYMTCIEKCKQADAHI